MPCSGEHEIKRFSALDGLGLTIAGYAGLSLAILSGRKSIATLKRFEALRIPNDLIFEGYVNKLEAYELIRKKLNLDDEAIAYMGDDIIDIPVLKRVGFAIMVPNGRPELKEHVHYTTSLAGGHGAVREIIDLILKAQDRFEDALEKINHSVYKQ